MAGIQTGWPYPGLPPFTTIGRGTGLGWVYIMAGLGVLIIGEYGYAGRMLGFGCGCGWAMGGGEKVNVGFRGAVPLACDGGGRATGRCIELDDGVGTCWNPRVTS